MYFDLDESDWDFAYDSTFSFIRKQYEYVIPMMRKNKWGRIININSLSAKQPAESLVLSNAFRTAVIALSKSISLNLIKDNITIEL